MSKKEEEIVKPEDYVAGGAENITGFVSANTIQLIFTILLLVWVISSTWISIYDVFSGNFEHNVLSISFFTGGSLAIYLQVRKTLNERKKNPKPNKKTKGCSSCGK